MFELIWYFTGLNLVLLSADRLLRKLGKPGFVWVRRYCPELGATVFIAGGVLQIASML